jgi:beta-glucoside operon transcriptional antiterminator
MEYEISEWALDYINATLDIELPEEECGFIVLHIINASAQMDNTSHAKRVIKMTKDLCTIVDEYYSGEYERDGLDYSRFLTHLKYFSIRYLNRNQIEEKDTIKITFSDEAVSKTKECMKKINDYLNSKYGTLLNEHEQQYLMLHFCRLLGIN